MVEDGGVERIHRAARMTSTLSRVETWDDEEVQERGGVLDGLMLLSSVLSSVLPSMLPSVLPSDRYVEDEVNDCKAGARVEVAEKSSLWGTVACE